MNKYEKYKQIAIKIALPTFIIIALIFLIVNGSSSKKELSQTQSDSQLSLFNEDELLGTRYHDSIEEKLNYAVEDQDNLKEDNEKMKEEIKALKELILKQQKTTTPQESINNQNLYKSFPSPYAAEEKHTVNQDIINPQPQIIYKVYDQDRDTNVIDPNFGKLEPKTNSQNLQETVDTKLYIPTTAISTGSLLHGLNAPTNMNQPMPTVIMIKDVAFLPRKQLNIKECNLMIEAYGQLSDERVYGVFTKFVCISEDGKNIYDTKASGYITSLVDNKQGLPGHVVSKQDAMLKRMFLAGAFEGVSEMFKDSGASTITSALGTTTTQSTDTTDKAKNIIAGGLSTASESAKQLYLDKAKNISETMEVLAQDVGLVFTDGLILEPIDLNKKVAKEIENEKNN